MRHSGFALIMFVAASAGIAEVISRNPGLTLAGEKLHLAYVEGGGKDAVLNEYIRKDETFENWKILFAVRLVKSAASVDEVVGRWKAYLSHVPSPGMNLSEHKKSRPTDRRYTLSIRAPGDAYVENDEMRFFLNPQGEGVIYYQAAVRVDPNDKAAVEQGRALQEAFGKALESLDVSVVETMPK